MYYKMEPRENVNRQPTKQGMKNPNPPQQSIPMSGIK